jgi:proline iminopeptidase
VIAVHGGPGETMATLHPALDRLARDRVVIYYDQRGNGRSSEVADSTRVTIDYHIADLEALRAHFKLERVTLLGHSWGGGLVALYAARHPERIARLVLVDAVPPRSDPFDRQSAVGRMAGFDSAGKARIGTMIRAILADAAQDPVDLCRRFYQFYLRNYFVDPAARTRSVADDCGYPGYRMVRAARISRLTEESGYQDRRWDERMSAVKAPVLVIHGRQDFIPIGSAETWAGGFADARLLVIDRSSHSPFFDRPDAFFPAVASFLDGRWPPGSRVSPTSGR